MIKVVVSENEWLDFIPEFNGNKEQPEKEQITCKIKLISQEDQDKLTDKIIGQQRDGFRQKQGMKWSQANFEVVNSHVKEIKNVFIVKNDKEIAVNNMAELYKVPQLKALYSEIANALDGNLTEQEIKNSDA